MPHGAQPSLGFSSVGTRSVAGTRRAASPVTLVATFVVLMVLVGATILLAGPRDQYPHNPAAALLPADGHRRIITTDDSTIITEAARSSGSAMLASGPSALSMLATSDLDSFLTTSWLRLLETRTGQDGVTHTMTALQLTDDAVLRSMEISDAGVLRWDPPQVVLPQDVQDGATWQGEGTLISTRSADGEPQTSRFSYSASAHKPSAASLGRQGCLEVRTSERVGDTDSSVTETWCPGEGAVTGQATPTPAAPDSDLALDPEVSWHPAAWRLSTSNLNAAPPVMLGSQIPPAGTADILAVAHHLSGDIVLIPDGDVNRAHRVHPGGLLTAMRSFGDVVVAATTRARVSAYDLRGAFLWQVELPDVMVRRPALIGDDVVLTDGSGHVVAVDARTGTLRWEADLPDQVILDPVACGTLTLLATTGNEVVIIDAGGSPAARIELLGRASGLTCNPSGELVISAGGLLMRFDAGGSLLGSVNGRDATVQAVMPLEDAVITLSARAVTSYDANTLEQRWRLDHPFTDVVAADGYVVALDQERIVALDATGVEAASWPTDAAGGGFDVQLIPYPDGVGFVSPTQTWTRLG